MLYQNLQSLRQRTGLLMLNEFQLGFEDFFEALGDETVILEKSGAIVAANKAWRQFCAENGGDLQTSYVGTNVSVRCRCSAAHGGRLIVSTTG